jgi:hypothetical protein
MGYGLSFDIALYLRGALLDARWRVEDLWLASCSLGGTLERSEVAQVTAGSRVATRGEYEVLAAALNEHFHEIGLDAVAPPYGGPDLSAGRDHTG